MLPPRAMLPPRSPHPQVRQLLMHQALRRCAAAGAPTDDTTKSKATDSRRQQRRLLLPTRPQTIMRLQDGADTIALGPVPYKGYRPKIFESLKL